MRVFRSDFITAIVVDVIKQFAIIALSLRCHRAIDRYMSTLTLLGYLQIAGRSFFIWGNQTC